MVPYKSLLDLYGELSIGKSIEHKQLMLLTDKESRHGINKIYDGVETETRKSQ